MHRASKFARRSTNAYGKWMGSSICQRMSANLSRDLGLKECGVGELQALRSAPVGIAVTSLAGSLRFANEAFGRFFGVDRAANVGGDIRQITRGLLHDDFLMRVAREGGPQQIGISTDPDRAFVCTATRVMHGAFPIYLSFVVQDISDLAVDYRERWQLAREVLRAHGVAGLWHWTMRITDAADVGSNPLRWISSADDLFGAGLEPATFGELLQRMKPECRERVVEELSQAMEVVRASYAVDYELQERDGTVRYMRSVGCCVEDLHSPNRTLIGFELELNGNQAGEHRDAVYLKLIEHMEVPMASIDRNLRYRYFNPAFAALFDSAEGQGPKLGQPVLSSIGDSARRRRVADVLARATKGYPSIFENEFVDERGEVRQWVDFHFKPIRDASGAIDGTMAVGYDVTPLKRANLYKKSLGAELRRGFEHRAAHIDAANRDLSNRVAVACDDLRARLQQVRTWVEGSATGVSTQDIAAALQDMESSLEGLAQLSEVGLRRPERRKIDMNRLVKEIQHDLSDLLEGRSVEFDIGPLPHVVSDRVLVKQILQNLLSNAIKFTRGRSPARIRVWTSVENGVTVWSMADNGPGFDMKDAEEMFNSFARRGTKPPGTGLSIAWRAVQQLNGRLWCQSSPSSGATFHFTMEDHES
jgi:PAS domain S-box-containing protein